MATSAKFHGFSEYEKYPDLEARKQLVARMIIARNLGIGISLRSSDDQKLIDDLVEAAIAEARSIPNVRDGAVWLDKYLSRILRRIDKAHRDSERLFDRLGDFKQVLANLKKDVANISCESCVRHRLEGEAKPDRTEIKNLICRGVEEDLQNLVNGAFCWRSFLNIFHFALDTAEQAYAPFLNGNMSEQSLIVEFHTRVTRGPDLGARTVFPIHDQFGQRKALVQIDLPLSDFNYTHYLSLPYYIFHEVCVHGPEAWMTVGKRSETNERCPFREGFVDAAAARLLVRALQHASAGYSAGGVFADHAAFAEHFKLETNLSHYRRADVDRDELDSRNERQGSKRHTISRRKDGMRLFERLADREISSAVDEAIRIALGINLLCLTEAQRVNFLARLDWASDPAAPPSGKRSEWMHSVRELAKTGNLQAIRDWLEQELDSAEF